jgi:hypothetical protein
MALYRIYVYLHVLGAMGWFLAMGIEAAVLFQLARATSLERRREALAGFRGNRLLGPVSALLVLGPGIYMAQTTWTPHPPWVGMGYLTFILAFLLGAAVTGRRMIRLERELGAATDPSRAIAVPLTALRVSLYARIGLLLGATYAMVVKPQAVGGVAAVVIGLAVGLLAALAANRGVSRSSASTGVATASTRA